MLAITIGALAFTPTSVVQPRSVVVQMRTGPPSMNFFDDMQTNFKKMMQQPPSLDEAVELCRDDESTGCTLEMCAHRHTSALSLCAPSCVPP